MPLVNVSDNSVLGNLVVREFNPADGYCRDEVLFASGGSATTMPMGTVVAKAAGATTYHKVAAGDLSAAGTVFGVVIGDHYDIKPTFTIAANVQPLVLAYVRGPVQLSDYLIRQANTLTDAQFTTLFGLMKAQGVIVLKAV